MSVARRHILMGKLRRSGMFIFRSDGAAWTTKMPQATNIPSLAGLILSASYCSLPTAFCLLPSILSIPPM